MNTNQKPVVTGLFKDKESAERAYQAINSRGYQHDETNVMMSDQTRSSFYPEGSDATSALADKTMAETGTGAMLGGTLGAVLGGIAAIGTSVLLPGLGLIVAGPLFGALAGAGAGGAVGGLVGALGASGIPEEVAGEYESGVRSGGVVMGVHPRNEEDAAYFHNEFRSSGGEHVAGVGVGTAAGALAGAAIGTAIVPVAGTAIGAVVGGIAGAAGGHEVAEHVNPKAGDEMEETHPVGTTGGAVGGAAAGALIGSAVPVVGTAVGGVVGGIAGAVAGHEASEDINPKPGDDDGDDLRSSRRSSSRGKRARTL